MHNQVHAPRPFPCAKRHVVDLDHPRLFLEKAGHAPGKRRFPSPVVPHNTDDATWKEVEIETVQDRRRTAVAGNYAAHTYDGFPARRQAGNGRIDHIGRGPHRHNGVDFGKRGGAQPQIGSRFKRQRKEIGRRPVSYNRTIVYNHIAVCDAVKPPQAMLGDKHGLPLTLQKRNRSCKIPHRMHIERRSWFIKHEDIRMYRIGRCQDNRLLLPTGKRLGTAPEQALDTERCRCLRHTFDHFLAIDSEVLASEGDFRGHVEIDELATRVLEHRPDIRGKLAHRPCGNGFSRNKHLTLKVPFVHKRNKRINEARKRCLATS